MVLWLLQDVGKSQMLKDNFGTVQELNYSFANVGVLTDSSQVSGLADALSLKPDAVITRCGVKLIELIHNAKTIADIIDDISSVHSSQALAMLKKGVFYSNQNFDQNYYSTLGLPLLNADAFFLGISNNLNQSFDTDYFVKPTKDLKTLDPGILKAGVTVEEFILNSAYRKEIYTEKLLVAPVKSILAEYRFFVVNKKIVAYSQYKIGDQVKYSEIVPQEVLDVASKYALLYQPHDVFTMDLAVMKNKEIKIVEYNCWNGSGLYACDKKALFKAVQEHVLSTA